MHDLKTGKQRQKVKCLFCLSCISVYQDSQIVDNGEVSHYRNIASDK
jgi:hypothetical protein